MKNTDLTKQLLADARRQIRNLKRNNRRNKNAIAKLREENRRLKRIGFSDELTKLLKRTPVIDRLERELRPYPADKRASHNSVGSIAILALDLEGFKRVNDELGHEKADGLLMQTARAIQGSIRTNDLAARWGGDEFRVVLWNISEQTVSIVADRIRNAIRAIGHGIDVRIGGVIWQRNSGVNVTAALLLQAADDNERLMKRRCKSGTRITPYEH